MRLFLVLLVVFLSACEEGFQHDDPLCAIDAPVDESGGVIWNASSQRIEIERFNGYAPSTSDRYDAFDRSRDTLSSCAKNALARVQLVDELECHNDAMTLNVVVTDGTGLSKRYMSSNANCGHISDVEGFFLLDDMSSAVNYVEKQ